MRSATVLLILELRAMYLANGASPLKHWDQISDRTRSSARKSTSVQEWSSALMRSLQLAAPSKSASSAISSLLATVAERSAEWLDLVERECGLLMALAREEAERRKDVREAGKPQLAVED